MNNVDKIKPTGLFTNYIYKAIPLAFDESMSYYETLCGLKHYLLHTVIPALNNNADAIIEVQNLITELQNYIDNYFDNLDVQEEINNKLDEMVESGTLQEIIANYLNSKAIFGYDTVENMKNAENLINGSYAQILGKNTLNDGNIRLYKIRQKIINETTDDINKIELNNGLIAESVIDKNKYEIENIGIFQNYDEKKYTQYLDFINFGEPNEPPLIDEIKNKGIDIIAHWYNDFGLKATALSENQALGSWKWYDWSWNFKNKESYDPSRVPLLGYYQGDDRKTLDWILYWLGKAGVNTLSLVNTSGIDMTNWNNQSNHNYWEYVLMTQCKNIKSFKVIPWLLASYTAPTTDYQVSVTNVVDFVRTFKNNIHTYNYNGKRYVTCYSFEFEAIRGAFDNYSGSTNTLIFLKDFASQIQALGFDGICILARNKGTTIPAGYNYIDDGLIIFKSNYSDTHNSSTYSEYATTDLSIDTTNINDINQVLNVMTSANSSPEHTSTYSLTGSTPELFSTALNKTIQTMNKYKLPKMITIYNVSEWAEGGPGLIPNIQDGFGYLNALSSCQNITETININKIINDSYNKVFAKSKNLLMDSIQIDSVDSAGKTIEFTNLYNIFNYQDHIEDYIFMVSLSCSNVNTDLSGLKIAPFPSFSTKRIYAKIYNSTGSTINLTDTPVYANILIMKKNV